MSDIATLTEKRPRGRPPGKDFGAMISLHLLPRSRAGLDTLAERNGTDLSEEVRRAIDAHLRHAGIWPDRAD
jgi:hypothetical protein